MLWRELIFVLVLAAALAMLLQRRQWHATAIFAAVVGVVAVVGTVGVWQYRTLGYERDLVARDDRLATRAAQREANDPRWHLATAVDLAVDDDAEATARPVIRAVIRAPEPDDVDPKEVRSDDLHSDDDRFAAATPQDEFADTAIVDANSDHGGHESPPTWLKLADGKQPDGRFRMVVSARGWEVDRCWREIRMWHIPPAVRSYAITEIGGRWPVRPLGDQVADSLISDSYIESKHAYTGLNGPRDRIKVYALLDFPPSLREMLLARRAAELIEIRLLYTSLAAALVLGSLVVVFGYLKTDDATEGQYTRPLRVVAGLSLVGLAVAVIALMAFAISEESHFGGLLALL